MLTSSYTAQFRKDYKLAEKRGLNLEKLKITMRRLAEQSPLDPKFKDHKKRDSFRENRKPFRSF